MKKTPIACKHFPNDDSFASDKELRSLLSGKWFVSLLVLLAVMILPGRSVAQIVNGGFEDPHVTHAVQNDNMPNSKFITGWEWEAADVPAAFSNSIILTNVNGHNGTQAVILNSDGVRFSKIAQVFPTTPGAHYRLVFWFNNEFGDPQQNTTVAANVNINPGTIGSFIGGGVFTNPQNKHEWTMKTLDFTALTVTSVVEFHDPAPRGSTDSPMIDDVELLLVSPRSVTGVVNFADLGVIIGSVILAFALGISYRRMKKRLVT